MMIMMIIIIVMMMIPIVWPALLKVILQGFVVHKEQHPDPPVAVQTTSIGVTIVMIISSNTTSSNDI